MAGKIYVEALNNLSTGQILEGIFVVTNIDFVPFKQKPGKFLACTLADRTGTVKGVVWENAEAVKFKNDNVIKLRGSIGRFNDQLQVVIEKYIVDKAFYPTEFVKSLPKEDYNRMRKQFLETQKSITDPVFQKVWRYCDEDEKFWLCPGGKGVHHAYLHGLADHTIEMLSSGKTMIRQYGLDAQLLLTGILAHDIGKTWAYTWQTTLGMTDLGKLVDHTALGVHIIANLFSGSLNDERVLRLLHMVESHHGQFGTIKPMFQEAAVLAHLDNISATVDHIDGFTNEATTEWTQYDKLNQCSYFVGKKNK